MLAVNEPERRLILKDSGINFVVNCENVLLNFSEVTTLKEILYYNSSPSVNILSMTQVCSTWP